MSSLKLLFGKRMKELREQHGMTQLQLGMKIGLTNDEVSNIERGLRAPRFEALEKLAQELHVPVWKLFYFDSP
jgi:transcriptional regulator with XRE-family HTH domain